MVYDIEFIRDRFDGKAEALALDMVRLVGDRLAAVAFGQRSCFGNSKQCHIYRGCSPTGSRARRSPAIYRRGAPRHRYSGPAVLRRPRCDSACGRE